MIAIKTDEQIDKMRKAGHLLSEIVAEVCAAVKPGVTTSHLNAIADQLIRKAGAVPSFYGYNGFPASLCASVDDAVVHGIPNDEPLLEGSIVGIDCGLILDGWQADMARTVPVGWVSAEKARLVDIARQCFFEALAVCTEGKRLGDIGYAVQSLAESEGFSVVRQMCGHGIGRAMHEDPQVDNFGVPGRGLRLKSGMTLAIEPMINAGRFEIIIDEWDVRTADGKPSAHYENTVLITAGKPEVLTMKAEA